jgi:hypothetical protein
MNGTARLIVVWFNRLVLAAATFIMTAIALRNLTNPMGATAPMDIVLGSPTAITLARVGLGGFPLGFAIVLLGCVISTDRLLTGLSMVAVVIGAATSARLEGLILDGATSFNLLLLRPELALLTLSSIGIVLERRRRQSIRAEAGRATLPRFRSAH